MANLSIPAIRERLFNTSKHEQTTSRNASNPFAASTFKGNVLTADVFESSAKKAEPVFTGKLKASALVGSISGIGERFQNAIQSVVAFGNRAKESVVNGWNKLNEIEISFNPLKEMMASAMTHAYNSTKSAYNSTKNLLLADVTEFIGSGISARSIAKMDDMVAARQLMVDNVAAWEAAI